MYAECVQSQLDQSISNQINEYQHEYNYSKIHSESHKLQSITYNTYIISF